MTESMIMSGRAFSRYVNTNRLFDDDILPRGIDMNIFLNSVRRSRILEERICEAYHLETMPSIVMKRLIDRLLMFSYEDIDTVFSRAAVYMNIVYIKSIADARQVREFIDMVGKDFYMFACTSSNEISAETYNRDKLSLMVKQDENMCCSAWISMYPSNIRPFIVLRFPKDKQPSAFYGDIRTSLRAINVVLQHWKGDAVNATEERIAVS